MPPVYEHLRAALVASGKSQYQLERDSGVSRSRINAFLLAKSAPDVASVEKLANCIGLQLGLIARVTDNPKKS